MDNKLAPQDLHIYVKLSSEDETELFCYDCGRSDRLWTEWGDLEVGTNITEKSVLAVGN